MSTITLQHRWSGATIVALELPSDIEQSPPGRRIGWAATEALRRGADLRGADLRDADLRGAYLRGAYLRGAYLRDADLRGADLGGAYLRGADLGGADLGGAYLRGAYLRDADLGGAYLRGADLGGADLGGAYLRGAYLRGAIGAPGTIQPPETPAERLAREQARAASFRERNPQVPVVPNLDAQILARVNASAEALEMSTWHTCDTTHCRAGWAVHLAGNPGYELEQKFDAGYAGRAIYIASLGYVPNFYAGNDDALADIRARAAEQVPA